MKHETAQQMIRDARREAERAKREQPGETACHDPMWWLIGSEDAILRALVLKVPASRQHDDTTKAGPEDGA